MKLRKLNEHINDLYNKSINLQTLCLDDKAKDNFELRKKQDETYKKWLFMKELYKASRDINNEKMDVNR